MKKVIVEITAFLLCLILLFSVTWRMGYVLMPERHDYGGTWNMYLQERENSIDIMLVGSSHVYCNVIPAIVYENTGYSTYCLTAPCLTMPLAYYYIKEGLKTQSPQVIMLEATGFFFNRYMGHAKAAIGYMPPSANRLMSIITSAEPSERAGLLFPLYNYHDRWEDFKISSYFEKRADEVPDINAGYTYLNTSEPQKRAERVFEYTQDDIALQQRYLKKIIQLCESKSIQLEIVITPAASYVSDTDKQYITAVSGNTKITDFNDDFDALGLDLNRDFYDARHLNVYGAKKFSSTLSQHILNNYTLQKSTVDKTLWDARVSKYK